MDDRLGLTDRMVALLGDSRDSSRVRHSRREQLRQRVYQISLGYEDCNDADWLRHDPALRFACDSDRDFGHPGQRGIRSIGPAVLRG
jgi:hypothetical protein